MNININKDLTLLVPAAGIVKTPFNFKSCTKDPSFLNMGHSLAIEEIRKKYDCKLLLSVHKKSKNFFKLMPFNGIEILEVGLTKSIAETLYKSLENVKSKWCLINPITTLPDTNFVDTPFIEFGSKLIPKEEWSSLIFNKDNDPFFINKSAKKYLGILSHPFTGRILAETEDLISVINNLEESKKNDCINIAISLFKAAKVDIKFSKNWLDIGHEATYPLLKKSTITSRFFNSIITDERNNSITKKSSNKQKIDNEISFYKNIPNKIKRYFPEILRIEQNASYSSYEMEFISKPTLSEIYLFNELGHNSIFRIFISIEKVLNAFYENKHFVEDCPTWIYSAKTNSRIENLSKIINQNETDDISILKSIYNNSFKINNINFPSLERTFFNLKEQIKKFDNISSLFIGHGDLCFNNILVDPLYGDIKLIDPKAEQYFDKNIYGLVDKFYDLSKLNHSIEGIYDSVVNNLYRLEILDIKNISFEVYKPKEYDIYNMYFTEIISYKRIKKDDLRLLTANLFFSMLPLHIENVKKVIALAFIGNIFFYGHSIKKVFL